MAQLFTDLAVAGGLPGLTFQLGELRGELFDDVVDAGQILLGAVQLQLGLVTALVEAGDARGLLEDAPAGLGLGVDQLGNLALAHQRRGMGAGRGVGEEHLHVAGADILAVDLVGGAHVAGDAADDLEMVGLVEAGGREAVGIVDMDRDLGEVARGAGGGAGEDHVLHPRAAHRGGAVLAHDPAQRLQQVRLAAAIGAHHAGEAVLDIEVGRVDEALEAGQPEF